MKKLLIIAGTIIGFIVVVLIGLTLFVKSYLQSDKLKALIIPKVEQATGRKVAIDAINVSIFSGISVQGLHLKEKDGSKDFVAAREFVLKYDLLPLLSKNLVINTIQVVDPAVNISRNENGVFSYEDVVEHLKSGQKGEEPKPATGGGMPFSVSADKIGITNAKIDFTDAKKELPNIATVADAELKVAAGGAAPGLSFSGKVNIKSLDVVLGAIATRTSGTIEADPENVTYALTTVVSGESFETKGSVKNYSKAPEIHLDLYSKQLDLVKLMALGGNAKHEEARPAPVHAKALPGKAKPAEEKKTAEEKNMDIKAAGEIKVDTATYEGNTLKNFVMKYRYSGGVMTADPVSMNFAGGDKVDLAGTMKGDMIFHYVPGKGDASEQIKNSALGKMVVDLSKVVVKESKVTDAVARFTGLDDLKQPSFDKGHFDINIKDRKMLIEGQLTSPRVKATPTGSVGFDKAIDMLADIEVSPDTASKMKVSGFTGFMAGKDGWTLIPLKITGTTDKPSVGVNQAVLKQQLKKGIEGEIEKRFLKSDSQQKDGKSENPLKGLFGK
ncbi:MAG TPA: AsmA family protein [Dissulfurispiraceae bacterium]|nr:AsmA family protein [Dissulfurispiraceae bacterium]